MKYSVVIPVYNEQEVLPLSFKRIKKVMDALGEHEIIFVNDGSRDSTLDLLRELAAADKAVRVISFSRNFGHQEAVSAGMAASRGDAIIIIDCDLQDPPEVIPKMVEKWQAGADIVYGLRIKRNGETAFKKFSASFYYKTLKALGGQYIPADTGDFRLIDRKVCDVLTHMPERNRFLRGMAAWAGFKAEPVEFVREERAAGHTKYSPKKMLKLAADGITSFSNKPLKYPFVFGCVLSVIAFLYLVLSVVMAGLDIWPLMHVLFGTAFLLIGMLFVSIGILGLYLGRIYDEAKARPVYIIDQKINFDTEE